MEKAINADNVTALQWVADELKLEVGQALRGLEEYVEQGEDKASLDECTKHLAQISGIFSVTGLPLPSLLCAELQDLAIRHKDIPNVSADDCLSVLAEALLAVGAYLNNPKSSSVKLASQVNNMRALLDREMITESAAFEPNMESGLRVFSNRADDSLDSKTLRKLRTLYQRSVLSIIKSGLSDDAFSSMQKVFKVLYQMGGTAYLSALGYCCSALIDRLADSQLSNGPAVVAIFKRIDEVLRKRIAGSDYEDTGLLKNVLFYVAIGVNHQGPSEKVVNAFSLSRYTDNQADSNQATPAGLEPDLVAKVVEALRTEIEQAKTWLDDCLHQTCSFKEAMENVETILKRVDDTLVMVNTEEPRALTKSLLELLASWQGFENESEIPADDLDQFATLTVNLENTLVALPDAHKHAGARDTGYGNTAATIIRESRGSLNTIKESISAFIEGGVDWDALEDVPANLTMVEGALRFYPLEDLGNVVQCAREYVRESLLGHKREPDQAEIDLFADVIVAIDYYLECLERGTAFNLDFLVERALDNCSRLGYPFGSASKGSSNDSSIEKTQQTEREDSTIVVTDPLHPKPQETPITPDTSVAPPVDSTDSDDDADDEIIDIFVEEAEELLPLASEYLTAWQDSGDKDALNDLRRGFHTLKGGGRMIGATTIGELSWGFENLLNRVIDKTVEPHSVIFDTTEKVLAAYPALLADLKNGEPLKESADVAALREYSFELADPKSNLSALPATNTELTETFIREAEELRDSIVRDSTELAQDEDNVGLADKLLISIHRLADGAHNAEFEDLADSLKPLEKVLRHYNSIEESLSSEFVTLMSLWSSRFSECLTALRNRGNCDIRELDEIANQSLELLHKEEKELAQHSSNRKKRFRPLHRLMAEELEHLIIAEEIIRDWQVGQPQKDDLSALINNLNILSETGEMCQVTEITDLCAGVMALHAISESENPLSVEKADAMSAAYEHLLIMLDAVASWLMIPKVPQGILQTLEQLTHADSDQSEAEQTTDPENNDDASIVPLVGTAAVGATLVGAAVTSSAKSSDTKPLTEDIVPADNTTEEDSNVSVTAEDLHTTDEGALSSEQAVDSYVGSQDDEDSDEFERELMETFLEEAHELVASIDLSLKSWQEAPTDYNNADSIHRALHTLKGGARLSGLSLLGNMSHDFESFIIDQQVLRKADDDFFNSALERLDALNAHLEHVHKSSLTPGPIVEPEIPTSVEATPTVTPVAPVSEPEPVAEAEAEAEAETKPTTEQDSPATATTSEDTVQTDKPVVVEVPKPAVDAPQADTPAPKAATLDEATADAVRRELRQETVRLRSDALDEMVNLAGETTVFRGRIEAQLNGLDSQLDELESTINRIQQLARRLDVETEAQINFRSEQIAESEDEADFDPLEMDRYSTLQQLSRQLIESASDLQDLRSTLSGGTRDTNTLVQQSSRALGELNDQLMSTRMVPFTQLVPRLERITRQVSRELAKNVKLTALNIEGELDRQILEKIVPALEHILRNSIDHGIEPPQGRSSAGKDALGHIYLTIRREGSYTIIRVADDGAGINLDAVKSRAVKNGLIEESEISSMTKEALLELLFTPGFSTASSVTQISGRGVGMDVVRSTLRDMGGNIQIETEEGKGTAFEMSIPFTLSVNRALMVYSGDDTYALPMSSVEALVRITKTDLEAFYKGESQKLKYGADEYDFGYLGELLQTLERPPIDAILDPTITLVLFRSAQNRIALMVDEVVGSQEVVVKSLASPFKLLPGVSGAAIMGDGNVIVALDMPTLVNRHYTNLASGVTPDADRVIEQPKEKTPVVMVVDDSVTVRKVTSRFLTRQGYIVESARDGVEALRLVHDNAPDLMLVDVEMPRMDGFELLSILRSTDKFKDLPVFLITSRTGEKHRERGLSLGAQQYFGKPYREDELIEAMNEYLSPDSQ